MAPHQLCAAALLWREVASSKAATKALARPLASRVALPQAFAAPRALELEHPALPTEAHLR